MRTLLSPFRSPNAYLRLILFAGKLEELQGLLFRGSFDGKDDLLPGLGLLTFKG